MPHFSARPARRPRSLAAVVGLCVGSFLNVVIHRLPKMLERGWQRAVRRAARREPAEAPPRYNLVVPRSACPACGHMITALREHPGRVLARAARQVLRLRRRDFGALSGGRDPRRRARGRARSGTSGPPRQGLAACVLLWTLLALTFIDFDTQLLPDDLTLPLLWAGLIVNLCGLFVPLRERRDRRRRRLPDAVDRLLAVQADPRQGGHGLRRLQAARRAGRVARLDRCCRSSCSVRRSSARSIGITLDRVQGARSQASRSPFGPYLAIAGAIALFFGRALDQALSALSRRLSA